MTGRLRVRFPAESYKRLKMVLSALLLCAKLLKSRARNQNWSAQCQCDYHVKYNRA